MLKKLLPVVLLLVGSGAGVGAGIFLRPPAAEVDKAEMETKGDEKAEPMKEEEPPGGKPDKENEALEYVKLSNQFVVPVVKDEVVRALVVLSLSLEVPAGGKDEVYRREPKLRDAFLQVLFDHANTGGFDGAFTSASNLSVLRVALREIGQKNMDADIIRDVLILEIARQDY